MTPRRFVLSHDIARHNAMECVRLAPEGFEVVVREPTKKSRPQEEKYHAQIGDITDQYIHAGRKWDAESMKRLLVAAFKLETKDDPAFAEAWRELGELEIAPAIGGNGFVLLGTQTRKFPKVLASGFIEWLYAFGAENDIRWSEPARRAA